MEGSLTWKTGATATGVGRLFTLVFEVVMSDWLLELDPVLFLRRLLTVLLSLCTFQPAYVFTTYLCSFR